MDGVVRRRNIQRAGLQVKIAVFNIVGSDQTVIARIRFDGSLFDAKTVIGMDGVRGRRHRDRTACDDQVIVGGNSVHVLRVYRKAPASVDRQIIVGKNSAVRPVIKSGLVVGRAAGDAVLAAFCQRQEHLVRLVDPNARVVAAVNLHTVKKNEDLGRIVGVHGDIAVCQRSGHFIVSRV